MSGVAQLSPSGRIADVGLGGPRQAVGRRPAVPRGCEFLIHARSVALKSCQRSVTVQASPGQQRPPGAVSTAHPNLLV
jgi:hypothetical protein